MWYLYIFPTSKNPSNGFENKMLFETSDYKLLQNSEQKKQRNEDKM